MRQIRFAAVLAISLFSSMQAGETLSIRNYRVVETHRVSPTLNSVTYSADLVNPGAALAAVSAVVSSLDPDIRVSHDTLVFVPLAANSQAASRNTFTILLDRRVPFDASKLRWTFRSGPAPPIADAGPSQTARVGKAIKLHGGASTNPSGSGALAYRWAVASRPAGSTAEVDNPASVEPAFAVDVPGSYELTLTVDNGASSSTASTFIDTLNTPPVADAGRSLTVRVASAVILNGSASSDVDGNALGYAWVLLSRPARSRAVLKGANSISPVFVADEPGTYVAQLVVNDGTADGNPSVVTITTENTPPVANADSNRVVVPNAFVQLNGSGSTDVDGNELTYHWTLLSAPAGSAAALNDGTAVNPAFTADLPGTYVAQLIVNDGQVNSVPATVSITTDSALAPESKAGVDQTVAVNSVVSLQGRGIDSQGRQLATRWALIARPEGSSAVIENGSAASPTFIADQPGDYVAQLIVNNGLFDSAPSTVKITTRNTAPLAKAGRNRSVKAGDSVQLDGSASSDADRDALSYRWSFLSRPAGSNAVLSGADTVAPAFVADMPGTYVAQLMVGDALASSIPVTASIAAAGSQAITLSPDPLNLNTIVTGTLTVTLPSPAGAGGQVVNLYVSDPSIASAPQSVTVPEGSTSINVTITPYKTGTTSILAAASGFAPNSSTINVAVPSITVTLDASFIGITRTTNGLITLSGPAQPNGATIYLAARPDGVVTLPATVTVPGGSTTASFTVTGTSAGSALITAGSAGYNTGTTNIQVGKLGQISLPVNVSIGTNQPTTYPITLITPAPSGGIVVSLTSSDPTKVALSTSSVTIPAGSTTPLVQPTVTGVNFGSATISASAAGYSGDSQTVLVAGSLSFSPSGVTLGTPSQTISLNLSSPAPQAGITVNLTSDNPSVASVPATVSFAGGATSAAVTITNVSAGSTVIHASAPNLADTTATVNVASFGGIGIPSGLVLAPGQTSPFPVTLGSPAPAAGVTVFLQSSDGSKVSLSVASVSIAPGATTPSVQPQVTGTGFGSAAITVSAAGYSSASRAVVVNGVLSFAPQTLTINSLGPQSLTLTLSGPAPAALTVSLASSNLGVATVPASVTLAAGASSVIVPVTSLAPGTTTITTSTGVANVSNAAAAIVISNSFIVGSISLQSNVKVGPNQSTPIAVTLSTPAGPSGVTVSLASSDPSVTVTPSVFISAGLVSPGTQPQVTGVNFGSSTITASAVTYTPTSQTVQVAGALSFSPASISIMGTATQNLTLNLSVPAPAGGIIVNLNSSNSSAATVPASVTIAGNTSSVTVPVTGAGPGSTTINASTNSANVTAASASATVVSAMDIFLPANLVVAPGDQVGFQVKLASPAKPGGVFVTLSSSDPSKFTLSQTSIYFPEGSSTSFTIQASGIGYGTASLIASASGLVGDTETVKVATSGTFSPSTVSITGAGVTQYLTLGLSNPAPAGGITVNLSSSNPGVATVPATVSFAANTSYASVPVASTGAGTAVIHANSISLADTTANVTVIGSGTIGLPANLSVNLGQTVAFPITLGGAAPAGGVTISLSSSDPSKISISTSSVFIPQGATTPATQPVLTGLNIGAVNITATALGYAPATVSAQGRGMLSFSPPSITISGNGTQNVLLSLASPAPAGGLSVTLTSDNPGVAQVQGSVAFFPDGSSQATNVIPITATGSGTTLIHASALPYIPDAVLSVTVVGPGAISLPGGVALAPKQTLAFPVTLSSPAPAGGVTVSLTSSDTSKATLSTSSVFISGGSTTPASQPQITGVNFGSATISASAPNYSSASQAVQVNGTLIFSPQSSTINSGTTQNITLNLSASVPTPLTVTLSSSNASAATVPASVTFGAGATSASVTLTGVGAGSATITANAGSANIANATANITVASVSQGTIVLPANVTVGTNQSAAFPITLSIPAPAGGVTVSLSSSDPSATVTPSVFIAGGAVVPSIQPQVSGVTFGSSTISATASGYVPATQSVKVGAALSFSPTSSTVVGTNTNNLALNLSSPAPAGGLTVTLSSSNPGAASVPATVTFAANATSVNVPVTGVGPGSATITASSNAANVTGSTASILVTAPDIVIPSGLKVAPGQSLNFQVKLANPAKAGGVFVTLASSDPSKLTVNPTLVFVPEGAMTASVQPSLTGVDFGTANLSATAPGLTGDTEVVQVGGTLSFSPSTLTLSGVGLTQSFALNLSVPAPAGGLVVTLSSSNTGVATVPTTVTFAPNSTSVSVPVTTIAGGSAVIHASGPNVGTADGNVSVLAPGTIGLPFNTSVRLGQTASFPITLGAPAPYGGVTVTLTVSDAFKGKLSSTSVFIPAGATVPAAQPTVTGLNIGAYTISASAPGFATATQNLQTTDTVMWMPTSITLSANSMQIVLLALASAAPPGDTTQGRCSFGDSCAVTLFLQSDNPAVAQVQSSVNFFPDGSSQAIDAIPIVGIGPGTTVIHAGAPPYVPDVTLTVTVTPAGQMSVSVLPALSR